MRITVGRSRRGLALAAAALLVTSLGRCRADDLVPRLERRVATEDRPLELEVALPAGAQVAPGLRVGDPALRYRFEWDLIEPPETVLRSRSFTTPSPRDRWQTVGVVEPYEPEYRGRLAIRVRVAYLRGATVLARDATVFPLRRVRDVTPPMVASGGDEEAYPPFLSAPLTVEDGGTLTTTDRLQGPDGEPVARSPFVAILDDGRVLEGADGPREARGTLELEWKNVWDNLSPPFGPGSRIIGRFGAYYLPTWDLAGSHHLVTDPKSPYMASARVSVDDPRGGVTVHLVDLSSELPDPAPEGGAVGSGRVRLPLPYDRVGELEVGFYAEDDAWPSPNQVLAGRFRFRVVDDISPGVILSLRRSLGREVRWDTVDSVNRQRWSSGEQFGLPPRFSDPHENEVAPWNLRAGTPYVFHVLTFDNTRLERAGMELELVGPQGATGFGIRAGRSGGRRVQWRIPGDGLDPALSRSSRTDPPTLYFGKPGAYVLEVHSSDVHGNTTNLRIPLRVLERGVDRVRVWEDEVRRRDSGGSR